MAVDKNTKEELARTPGRHTDQSTDQVHKDDPNPAKGNLARESNDVTSGRNPAAKPGDSAPAHDKKLKAAHAPSQPIGHAPEQPFWEDENPEHTNLASTGEKVVSGRMLREKSRNELEQPLDL